MIGSENILLCKELVKTYSTINEKSKKIEKLEKRIGELEKIIAEMSKKLNFYESSNMPTSQLSLFNKKRAKFRKSRGEDPSGSPGDPARSKKIGALIGHVGVSHEHTPEGIIRYDVDSDICVCGGYFIRHKPISKLISDIDGCKIKTVNALITNATCEKCNNIEYAKTPFLDGTSFGPIALTYISQFSAAGCVDRSIAGIFHALFGFKVSPNTITAARHAMGKLLEGVEKYIIAKILTMPWVYIDETVFKRGDGHKGYVWLVYCPGAVFVHFAATREAAVLDLIFSWLEGMKAVCDGYAAYSKFFVGIQRCWRHLLAESEKDAISNKKYVEPYDALLLFFHEIKKMKGANPFTRMDLNRRVFKIAQLHKPKTRTRLLNAIPNMFTFLSNPGMPLTNNAAERAIRDNVVRFRNNSHKITTPEGKKTFSHQSTFYGTCKEQGISPARAMLELLQDHDWNIFERKNTPYSLVNPDGTRFSIFGSPGPPILQNERPAGSRHQQSHAA